MEIQAVGKINHGKMTEVDGFPRMSFANYQERRERSKLRLGQKQKSKRDSSPTDEFFATYSASSAYNS
eukprot:9227344-Ditylum_brightwellii.AAC.1